MLLQMCSLKLLVQLRMHALLLFRSSDLGHLAALEILLNGLCQVWVGLGFIGRGVMLLRRPLLDILNGIRCKFWLLFDAREDVKKALELVQIDQILSHLTLGLCYGARHSYSRLRLTEIRVYLHLSDSA